MSKKKKAVGAATSAAGAVQAVRDNPYVQRVVEDDDLRDNVRVAYESASSAFQRLSSGKGLPKALADDKRLHADLEKAAEALKDIGGALAAPKKKKSKHRGRKLLVVVVAAGLAVGLSADLRNKVLDALFGSEEEFDYTSTTAPATPAPAPSPAPAS